MTNYAHGHKAEEVAAEYLKQHGFEIVSLNWKTRYCEIDVVVQRESRIYFVEVKYRMTGAQGGGLEYITAKKLEQMQFAAELWVSQNGWRGEYQLAAIEVSGSDYNITGFIQDLN